MSVVATIFVPLTFVTGFFGITSGGFFVRRFLTGDDPEARSR